MTSPVALVTGAGRGIGAAIFTALVDQGWRVAALDRAAPNPSVRYPMATSAELSAVVSTMPDNSRAIVADVTDPAQADEAVASVVADWGRLDAVVTAAGIVAGGQPVWEIDDDEWDLVLRTDLTGTFTVVRAAVPHLLDAPAGRVVTIASAAGSLGLHHMAAYAAAKHAVIGFTRSLAADLAGTGVTANAVAPGSTRTTGLEESARIHRLASTEEFVRHQEPLGRLIEPHEVAAVAAFLCSPAASAVTGAVVPVDGGLTATP